MNKNEKQNVPNIGPLPTGLYVVGKQRDHLKPDGSIKLKDAMPLEPDSSNTMHGRGDFWIHGDNKLNNRSASEGCLILGPEQRNRINANGANGVNLLQVVP